MLPSDEVCDCEDTTLPQSPAGYLSVQHFILAGDFNINLFDGFNAQSEYMNLLSNFNLVQHVTEPTVLVVSHLDLPHLLIM